MSETSSEGPKDIEVSEADMAEAERAMSSEATEETEGPFSRKTAWVRRMETPLRTFLRTETGSASVLAAATVVALIWANISISSYDSFWATQLSVSVGGSGMTIDLREFVNSGLMAFFFLVVGLAGMIVPISIYLLLNAGLPTQHGWGMAMSTDTAFALGALALVGRRLPDRVRTYLLTFSVVDDLAGLAVIAVAYSGHISVVPLLVGIA